MKKILLITGIALSASFFTLCKAQYQWHVDSLSSGMTSPGAYVLALAMKDSTTNSAVYAGGHFTVAGRNPAINIAEWVGTVNGYTPNIGQWKALGTGVNSDVCALAMYNKKLYAGGKFDTAGGIAASHIACWDTAALTWDSLVGNVNGNVYALCVYNDTLYAGGDFTVINGDTVNRIAKWNGTAWAAAGKGFDSGAVYALTVSNDTLYAGGSFKKSKGRVLNHVAKWTGSYWDSLGSGTNNTVYALADYEGDLMVGGAFTKSGNIATNYISEFNNYYSQSWGAFIPINDTVRALNAGNFYYAPSVKKSLHQGFGGGGMLMIGGNFDSADGYESHNWSGFGNGNAILGVLNGPVYALANPANLNVFLSGENYIGGKFSADTNIYYPYSVTLNNVGSIEIVLGGGIPTLTNQSSVTVYPNPSTGIVNMQLSGISGQSSVVEVYNMLGEKVYSQFTIYNSQFTINLSTQPNGVYLYRVITETGNLVGSGKLIIQK